MTEPDAGKGVIHWRFDWRFDVEPLVAELAAFAPADWHQHFNTGYHDGGWSGLALLSESGSATQLYGGHVVTAPGKPTPLLERSQAFAALLAGLPLTIQSARLLRLEPGSNILEHADDGIGLTAGTARLHIPVVTAPGVEFYVYGTRVPMAAGECWYLDLGLPHRVQNLGTSPRVHLVLDCTVDDRLLALLPDAATSRAQLGAIVEALGDAGQTSQARCERFLVQVMQAPAWPAGWDEMEDAFEFLPAVQAAGAAQGCTFSEEDVRGVMKAARRRWIEGRLVGMPKPLAGRAALTATEAEAVRLPGWTPMLVEADGADLTVELCRTAGQPFTEPFFEDSIQVALRRPAVATLRQRVSRPVLAQALMRQPGLPLGGLIFHMSRCGSTLLSQVLASTPRHRVLSEPAPLDAVLTASGSLQDVDQRCSWMRLIVGALAQPGRNAQERCFIKLDSWHTLQIDLFRRSFPEVPWVFVMRDPVEVIVSHLRSAGAQMVPGMVATVPPGLSLHEAVLTPREEYCARMLGAYCEALLAHWDRDPARGLLLDFSTLRQDIESRFVPHLDVHWQAQEHAALAAALQRDAKRPSQGYRDDVAAKQAEADATVRQAAERWVMPAYRALRERAGLPALATS